jgi:hypothetical protein
LKKIRLPFMMVGTDGTAEVAIPVLGWLEADDIARLGFDIELRGKTGNLEVALGYQTADNEDSPDAAVAITAFRTSNGYTFRGALTDIASVTAAKRLVRPVFIVRLSSGSTLAIGSAGGIMYVVKRA